MFGIYAPVILEPYVPDLSKAIVLGCLFDREINCRSASSAAFQECGEGKELITPNILFNFDSCWLLHIR